MKHERSWLVALAMTSAMVLGLSGTSYAAAHLEDEMYSYTQPGAELVMPYDTNLDKVSFLVASNIGDHQVSTHWTFWTEDCNEAVDFSICLTPNDTVVVDPRNMQAQGPDNGGVGPEISLSDVRGVVTVVAYDTDEKCSPFGPSSSIADNTIVGSFTFADTAAGYSFGNDALALGTDGTNSVQVPEPDLGFEYEYSLQVFNPTTVENEVMVLTRLSEESAGRTVIPTSGNFRFSTSFIDTTEIPTSLPDTIISCVRFREFPDFIPPVTSVTSSGIIRLQPTAGLIPGENYLYGIVGQAVGSLGASSSIKIEQVPGSASPAFIDGMDNGLF